MNFETMNVVKSVKVAKLGLYVTIILFGPVIVPLEFFQLRWD